MSFIQEPAYVIAIIMATVVFSEWLSTKKYFKHVGAVILVILANAVLANVGIIPSSHNAPALYDGIFTYVAPLGIFFLMLEVKLKELKFAGVPMLAMFMVGATGSMLGAMAGFTLLQPGQHNIHFAPAVAGMFTGTYIGGSSNLNAIALEYGVNKDGTLFAAINAVDNIITTPWMLATIVLPPLMQKLLPHKRNIPRHLEKYSDETLRQMATHGHSNTSIKDISLLLGLGFATLFIAGKVAAHFPGVPSIIVLTTLALIFAQLPQVQKLKGSKMLGMLLSMIFLAVIGAFCDIRALLQSGDAAGTLLLWVVITVLIHGFLLLVTGVLFKQDWDIVFIASNANIGGASSATVCAASLGRPDLQLPGLLAGSVGNAIGTYAGILVVHLLQ